MTTPLSRRTMLRGLGGVALGLPFLEAMLPRGARAQTAALPKRFALFFIGQSLGSDGDNRNFTIPTTAGAGYALSTGLQPLGDKGVQGDVSVISGLQTPRSTGPGHVDAGHFHDDSHFPTIHGCSLNCSSGDWCSEAPGVGIDQLARPFVGAGQTLGELHLLGHKTYSPTSHTAYTTFRRAGSAIQPVRGEDDLGAAFTALFGGFRPSSGPDAGTAADPALAKRKSVLDFVADQRQRLVSQVGARDKARLDDHFDQIRQLEMNISRTVTVPPASQTCNVPTTALRDPAATTLVFNGYVDKNVQYQYFNETERYRLMVELIELAFVCDATRVATMLFSGAHCRLPVASIGIPFLSNVISDVHELGHTAPPNVNLVPPSNLAFSKVTSGSASTGNSSSYGMSLVHAWQIQFFAELVRRLKAAPEGAGSVLDRSALMLHFEGGHGNGDNGDPAPKSHSTENMVVLAAGGVGGLKHGKHIVKRGEHPAKVTASLLKALGGPETVGEVTGTVPELFA